MAKNQPANLHREFTLLAISFAVAKLALLILAVCRATYAVELKRLIYLLLTIQLNRLTVFWVPLLPKPRFLLFRHKRPQSVSAQCRDVLFSASSLTQSLRSCRSAAASGRSMRNAYKSSRKTSNCVMGKRKGSGVAVFP